MTDETTEIKDQEMLRKRDVLRHGAMPQIMVFVNGLVISLLTFWLVASFTGDLAQEEYSFLAQNTAEQIERSAQDIHGTLDTIATVITLLDNKGNKQTYDEIRKNVDGIGAFHEILWLYQGDDKGWKYQNIYTAEANKDYTPVRLTPDSLRSFLGKNPLSDTSIRLAQPFHPENTPVKEGQNPVQALTKALEMNNPQKGVLIAVPELDRVFENVWDQQSALRVRISVFDETLGQNIYAENRSLPSATYNKPMLRSILVNAGDNIWNVEIEFLRSPKMLFIEYIPYLALIFGLSMTALGTIYVHNNQKKAGEMAGMNQILEYRNKALHREMKTREALNQSLERAERDKRAIINSVSDIIFETDRDGKILFLSKSWERITGFKIEQSLGQDIFEMLPSQAQEEQRQDFKLLVEGKKEAYRNYTKLRNDGGTFRAVELALSMTREDQEGNLRVVGTFTDVEEHRRAEKALADAEKKYRKIVENAAGGIYQMTPEGIFLSANPAMARILGYESKDELLKKVRSANESLYVDRKARQVFIGTLETSGQVSNLEAEIRRADGTQIWVNENARLVRDDEGNVLFIEGSIEDITQRKQSEISAEKARIQSDLANRAKSEFLANMSHELRTPLNSIIGFADIIQSEAFGPIETREYWDYAKQINESGKGLLGIINEILEVSKIEGGQRELNDRVVDLEKITNGCLDMLEGKAKEGQIEIQNQIHNPPKIIADELALKQIMLNVISNAIKFTPEGGRVTLSCNVSDQGELQYAISDTGVGMNEDEIDKALSPFAQLDTDLSRSGSGTGLGLTLVDLLVKLHGGRVNILSQKGTGTTVTIILPVSRVTWQADEVPSDLNNA